MNFAHFFINRPVFAIVLSMVLLIVGGLSIFTLPVSQYPEIAPPTVVVTASYPGANAQVVADTVATPIEQQINGVENMLYMSSQSANDGSMRLTVTFKLGTNLDIAQVQVQNRVAIAEPQLPDTVRQTGVTVKKSSPDITLVVQLYSPDGRYDPLYISNYALLQVRDELARLPGVGDIFLFGARDYSMRLWLDPMKLAARTITAGDVVQAISEQNVQVAAGVVGARPVPVGKNDFQLTVNALGRLTSPDQFEEIIIKTGEDGRITRVKDVARVELGAADYSVSAYLNGQDAVAIPIFQLPGTNAIATADAVRKRMEELKQNFPPGLEYAVPYDTTVFVRESVIDVVRTLFEAVLLVVIVVLVFLQNWRASLIPLLAIPVSIIGTFAVMWLLGFSINTLTLFGLVLAIGIVVDDAIVVVENVERWIEQGLEPREAAHKAMTEVTGAVIAIAFGLSAVFIPVAFVSGITGQFYRQFALTIAVATLLSAFNSLTLSPAMAALLLKPRHGVRRDWLQVVLDTVLGWFFKLFNKTLGAATAGYVAMLKRAIRFSAVVLLLYVGLLFLTSRGFKAVPTGFIPPQDTGYMIAILQMPDAASVDRTDAVMKRIIKLANDTPGVKDTFAITGYSFLAGTNQSSAGSMFIVLEPFEERIGHPEKSSQAITAKLMAAYSQIQEGVAVVFPPPPVRGIGTAGGFKMQIQDRSGGGTPQELQAATQAVIDAAVKRPEFSPAMFTLFRANVPQLYVNVDRTQVKKQDVNVSNVFETLQVYLGSLYVNDFNYLGRTYRVVAQAEAPFRAQPEDIKQLQTRNQSGQMVPLGAVLDVQQISGPDRISRYNQFRTAEINGTAALGVSTGTAIDTLEKVANEVLPAGYTFEWTELAYQEKLAGNTALLIFPLCVLFVWLTHSAEYESFALSTAIILIVPMCLLAGISGVWFRNMDNNIFTQIGFIVLAGLSAKNAVLIVEFAKQQHEEHGKSPVEAAIEAARLRLRPILMTSFAFILGVVPLVIARGAGAEMRQALGTAVFYGMIGVTLFGIFLTPVFFVTIRRIVDGRRHQPKPPPAPPRVEPEPLTVGAAG